MLGTWQILYVNGKAQVNVEAKSEKLTAKAGLLITAEERDNIHVVVTSNNTEVVYTIPREYITVANRYLKTLPATELELITKLYEDLTPFQGYIVGLLSYLTIIVLADNDYKSPIAIPLPFTVTVINYLTQHSMECLLLTFVALNQVDTTTQIYSKIIQFINVWSLAFDIGVPIPLLTYSKIVVDTVTALYKILNSRLELVRSEQLTIIEKIKIQRTTHTTKLKQLLIQDIMSDVKVQTAQLFHQYKQRLKNS